jgi:hypothetical protein
LWWRVAEANGPHPATVRAMLERHGLLSAVSAG